MKKIATLILSTLLLSCGDGLNTPRVTLFFTQMPYTGALGGRSGADDFCRQTWDNYKGSIGRAGKRENTHAVISTDVNDTIDQMTRNYNLPTNLPVYAYNTKVQDSWEKLLNLGVYVPLPDAGFPITSFWTGSNTNGTYNSSNCTNFTSTGTTGNYGTISISTGVQLFFSSSVSCPTQFYLMCVTY